MATAAGLLAVLGSRPPVGSGTRSSTQRAAPPSSRPRSAPALRRCLGHRSRVDVRLSPRHHDGPLRGRRRRITATPAAVPAALLLQTSLLLQVLFGRGPAQGGTCKAVWGSWMSRAPGYRGRGMLRRNGSYRVSCGARTGRSLASKGLVSRQCAAGGRPVCDPRVQANGLPAHGASRGSTPLVSEWLQGRRDGGRALREQLEGLAARYLLVRPRVQSDLRDNHDGPDGRPLTVRSPAPSPPRPDAF